MRSGMIFNIASFLFLFLTLSCCLVTVAWLAAPSTIPGPLVPKTDVPLPTLSVKRTLAPTATFTATNTPLPTQTPPPPTWTPLSPSGFDPSSEQAWNPSGTLVPAQSEG